ncbi:hypothetical protein JCM33374_g162 [Metschnikowia sp. JCM 33374]|nr:hypothetical protein JCM33374_g162 [Metschnikowia sp. JCM 33374]
MRNDRSVLLFLSKGYHPYKLDYRSVCSSSRRALYLCKASNEFLIHLETGRKRYFGSFCSQLHQYYAISGCHGAPRTQTHIIPTDPALPISEKTHEYLKELGDEEESSITSCGNNDNSGVKTLLSPENCGEYNLQTSIKDALKLSTASQASEVVVNGPPTTTLWKPDALSNTSENTSAAEIQTPFQYALKHKLEISATENTDESSVISTLDDKKGFSPEEITFNYKKLKGYCKRMSTLLFLEEESRLKSGQSLLFTSLSFSLDRREHPKYKNEGFFLDILVTPPLIRRFQAISGNKDEDSSTGEPSDPALEGQTVVLILDNRVLWFGYLVNPPKSESSKRNGYCKVYVRLYPWTPKCPPPDIGKKDLKIMFVSTQVNRMFKAMSRLHKSSFQNFILGQSKIRHTMVKPITYDTENALNESQKSALSSVLKKKITVIQGPPGTGKTSTIHEMILQLLKKKNFPIIVVAASNVAVDNIAEKMLSKHANSILRITAKGKESEYTGDHCLASVCLHTRFYDASPPELQELIKYERDNSFGMSEPDQKKLKKARKKFLKKEISERKVIFTTTMTAAALCFDKSLSFPVVIMDEATQSSEPATLIPLTLPGVKKLVLVGDQKQLSCYTNVKGLSLSLFERIIRNGSFKSLQMLDTQYRMHPSISAFPSKQFYGDKLLDGISAADRKMIGIPTNPVLFWDTQGKCPEETVIIENDQGQHRTMSNIGEALYVEQTVMRLIREKNIKRSRIGIITPYRGQRNQICSILMRNRVINPRNELQSVDFDSEEFSDNSTRSTIQYVSGVMIASIDAFQGREKDFIVVSCVRSNTSNQLGFLNDRRRLNVALTRAKYGLILIGDLESLKQGGNLWSNFVEFLESSGSVSRSSELEYR